MLGARSRNRTPWLVGLLLLCGPVSCSKAPPDDGMSTAAEDAGIGGELTDLDYSIPDGDRTRPDLRAPLDAGLFPLPECGAEPTPASIEQLFTEVIRTRCTLRCHSGAGAGAQQFSAATSAELYQRWVSKPSQQSYKQLVTPREPERSYVVDKILDKQGAPPVGVGSGSGLRMPYGCNPMTNTCLTATETCKLINWIRAGARP